jgi:two-component system response regulator QseB
MNGLSHRHRPSPMPAAAHPFGPTTTEPDCEAVYRGRVLRFGPQPTPDRGFLAYVIVMADGGFGHTEASVTPDLPPFARREDAAHAGLLAGQRWVDLHADLTGLCATMRVLLIEDDAMIGRAAGRGLRDAGFAVDWVTDGAAGQAAAANGVYDAVVLDLGLPRLDGMSLLQRLRARRDPVPVLIISARDAVADRIAGLNAGADDYLLKPFDLDELIARLRALIRRQAGTAAGVMTAGGLSLDPVARRVTLEGRDLSLTAREFALLEALVRRPGAVLSRERLEESIYGWGEEVGSNAVEVHLHNLRRKLGTQLIRNVRGVGYKIVE